MPFRIAFRLCIAKQLRFSTGAALCSGKRAVRRAEKRAGRPKARFSIRRITGGDARALSARLAALRHFLRHVSIDSLSAGGTISTPDAARTAILGGCAQAAAAALRVFPQVSIRLRTDFSAEHSRALVCGMFSIRAGHIILAAAIFAARYIKGGIAQWKNTRLKTS